MASINDLMLDQTTGEIDHFIVVEAAKIRAEHEFGGPGAPPKYHREALQWCTERAELMQRQWRQHRGIKDDSPTTLFRSYAPATNE